MAWTIGISSWLVLQRDRDARVSPQESKRCETILLSNINMQPLVRALRPWDMSAGANNSILADLSAADLPQPCQDVTHVFCLYYFETLMGNAFYGGSPEQCEKFLQALDSFCTLHKDKIAIANLFSFSSNRWLGFADVLHVRAHRERARPP